MLFRSPRYNVLEIAIAHDREKLKERAAGRLRERIAQGLPEEVEGLLDAGVSPTWLDHCGIEYKYFSKYVLGELTLEEATNKTITAINQYNKRQYTWWRRHPEIQWVQEPEEAVARVTRFLGR